MFYKYYSRYASILIIHSAFQNGIRCKHVLKITTPLKNEYMLVIQLNRQPAIQKIVASQARSSSIKSTLLQTARAKSESFSTPTPGVLIEKNFLCTSPSLFQREEGCFGTHACRRREIGIGLIKKITWQKIRSITYNWKNDANVNLCIDWNLMSSKIDWITYEINRILK